MCIRDRGFTAADFKQAQADGWEKQYQYKVGKKKVYMACLLYTSNTHEAIVDPETWQLAQQVKRTVRRTDTTGIANPLTGLVFLSLIHI